MSLYAKFQLSSFKTERGDGRWHTVKMQNFKKPLMEQKFYYWISLNFLSSFVRVGLTVQYWFFFWLGRSSLGFHCALVRPQHKTRFNQSKLSLTLIINVLFSILPCDVITLTGSWIWIPRKTPQCKSWWVHFIKQEVWTCLTPLFSGWFGLCVCVARTGRRRPTGDLQLCSRPGSVPTHQVSLSHTHKCGKHLIHFLFLST